MTNGPSGDIWFRHFSADEFCMILCFHILPYWGLLKILFEFRHSPDAYRILVSSSGPLYCNHLMREYDCLNQKHKFLQ